MVSWEVRLAGGTADLVTRDVRVRGRADRLTQREAELLSFFARHPGRTVPRDELLREVFGVHRATASRAVDTAISRLRTKIEPDPDQPVHLISVFGEGYRFEPGVVTSMPADRLGIPSERTPLVGRRPEITAILGLLDEHRVVALVGVGGVGKTRLAARVASEIGSELVLFVGLAETATVGEAVARVHHALVRGGAPPPTADLAGVVGRRLAAGGDVVLVLDCVEHLPGLADVLDCWLSVAARLRVLATTRVPLRLQGVEVRTVAVECLDPEAAATLYVERATAAGGQIHPADLDHVRLLVARLDHLPLAIELAAARARSLSPEQLWQRLDARLRFLQAPAGAESDPRQQSLRGALDWSWDLLPAPDRRALARLSVFPARIDAAAAAVVVGTDAPERLARLVDASLVQVVEGGHGLLESVRVWANEKAEALGERVDAELAHAAWHVDWLARLQPLTEPLRHASMVRIEAELPHLLAVVPRCARSRPDLAADTALLLWEMFQLQGPVEPYAERLDQALVAVRAAPDAVPPETLPRLLRCRATTVRGANFAQSEGDLHEAVAVAQERGLPDPFVAWLEAELALVLAEAGRFDEALGLFERAMPRVAATHTPNLRAMTAVVRMRLGLDAGESEALLRSAVAGCVANGQERLVCGALANLGLLLVDQGRVDEADEVLTDAIERMRRMGASRRLASTLTALGAVRVMQGRLDEADALAQDAQALGRLYGSTRATVTAMVARASLQLVFGDLDEGLRVLDEAELHMGERDRWVPATLEAYRAALLAGSDRIEAAIAATERSRSTGDAADLLDAVEGHVAWAQVRRARARGDDPEPHRARVLAAVRGAARSTGARYLIRLLPADGG